MKACPHCFGTRGYTQKVLLEYARNNGWHGDTQYLVRKGMHKVYLRRYCMDCKKCVSAALDMPTFKL